MSDSDPATAEWRRVSKRGVIGDNGLNPRTMTCPSLHLRSCLTPIHPRPPLQNTHLYSGDNYSEGQREREREASDRVSALASRT